MFILKIEHDRTYQLIKRQRINSVLDNHFTAESSDNTSRRFRKVRMRRMKQSTMFYKYNNVDELYSLFTSNINQYNL